MRETIEQMRERHNREIKELQKNCPHKHKLIHITVYGYMFHGSSHINDVCDDCGAILAYYDRPYKGEIVKNNVHSRNFTGPEERIETKDLKDWKRLNQFEG